LYVVVVTSRTGSATWLSRSPGRAGQPDHSGHSSAGFL